MKTLGSFIDKKKLTQRPNIDEKSVFYIFSFIIKEEYGRRGAENIIPAFLRDRKIFIKTSGSIWESEIMLNRKQIVTKINRELGAEEISDLAISK